MLPSVSALLKRLDLSWYVVAVAVYAAANLGLGMGLALARPSTSTDLRLVADWCRSWLLEGRYLYHAVTDYPPNGIVTFAPVALIPEDLLVPAWAAFTLLLTPALAYAVIRSTAPGIPRSVTTTVSLLFLCWGGTRTVLEFSRLCMALAFTAVLLAESRPVSSGLCLGFALAKPQIAGPILLWALVTRRARMVQVAALVVAAGIAVYCVRARASPIGVLVDWGRILQALYYGPDTFMGRTSLRPLWHVIAGPVTGDTLWLFGAGLLLVVPCAMTIRHGRELSPTGAASLRALFCLWSLMTIFHLGNNMAVLMLPAFTILLATNDPETQRSRFAVAGLIQFAMVFDIPVHYDLFVSSQRFVSGLARHFDRLVVVTTFAYLMAFSYRMHSGRARRSIPVAIFSPCDQERPMAATRVAR